MKRKERMRNRGKISSGLYSLNSGLPFPGIISGFTLKREAGGRFILPASLFPCAQRRMFLNFILQVRTPPIGEKTGPGRDYTLRRRS